MKLFLSPGACSLSPHIVLREAGLPFDVEKVDLKTKKTAAGQDFKGISAKGSVPALQLDDGQVLTEGPAIVQYLGDRKPEAQLVPAAGSMDRYRLQEWLNYITSEVHKGFSPLFNPKSPDESKKMALEALGSKFDYIAAQLGAKAHLLGEKFTVADAYLFTMLTWARPVGLDLTRWPVLQSYFERIKERPAVRAALDAEKALRT